MSEYAPHWLDSYIEYADAKSPMTPTEFHEGIGLWLISTAIARRIVARRLHADVYSNLWVMIIAPSTLFHKTTAIDIGLGIAQRAFPHLLFPNSSTPEAMVETLSGSNLRDEARDQAGQKGLLVDEVSGMLAEAGRDYMAGSVELIMKLYDCPASYQRATRRDGLMQINGAYFTFLAASTPAMLTPHLRSKQMWAKGWWPRFGIVLSPEEMPAYRIARAVDPALPESLTKELQYLQQRLIRPKLSGMPESLTVGFADGVKNAYDTFVKHWIYDLILPNQGVDDSLIGSYSRAPEHALKIATCLAAVDWPANLPEPTIEMRHWQRATEIAVRWVNGAKRAFYLANKKAEDYRVDKVRRALARKGDWTSARDLSRSTELKAADLRFAIGEMSSTQEVETRTITKQGQEVVETRLSGVEHNQSGLESMTDPLAGGVRISDGVLTEDEKRKMGLLW